MVRYPLGAMMSWVVQYLAGFKKAGHDVYFVEKFGYPDSCFHPLENVMNNDCSYGVKMVNDLLSTFDLDKNWCFADYHGEYHGMDKTAVEALFERADVYIDMGAGNGWEEERRLCACSVLIDGEPGYTHIHRAGSLEMGIPYPLYDHYYSVGYNVGKPGNKIPAGGINWKYIHDPVDTEMFKVLPPPADAPFTTLMNWQSHRTIHYKGRDYGQKDLEFLKFLDLPGSSSTCFELAVAGKNAPQDLLQSHGWKVIRAHDTTITFQVFMDYIARSKAEFSVCKNVFVALQAGLFSDRSAAFLAAGRPVIMQDTGFSDHLPCGTGLFAVNNLQEARAAVQEIESDWKKHSLAARAIALEYLDTSVVLNQFLKEIGINSHSKIAI